MMDEIKIQEKKNYKGSIFWLKGLTVCLAVMLFFTIVSRVAASFTVPKVSVTGVFAGKITHTVTASGMVEAGGERAVVTESGILVAKVNVHAGESVEEGVSLFTLDMDSLQEQIDELDVQIKKLQLENDSLSKNKAQAAQKQQLEQKRAQEDYTDTLSKNDVAGTKAQDALKSAEDEKKQAEAELNIAVDANNRAEAERDSARNVSDQAGKELEEAKKDAAQKEKELEQAKEALQNASDDSGEQEQLTEEVTEKQTAYDAAVTTVNEKQTAYDESQKVLSEKQTACEGYTANIAEKQSALDTAGAQVKEKQAALETGTQTAANETKNAARAVEDAALSADYDNTAQMNELSMTQYRKKLQKLMQLQQQNGEITAAFSGIITKVYVEVGQKTTDTAAVTMSDAKSGLTFTATTDSKNLSYLAVGDSVLLSAVGKKSDGCTVSSLETLSDGSTVKVSVTLDGDEFSPGESAQMTATRKSEEYDYTIPTTALRQENNKAYIFLLDTENTVLGEQYAARKVEVEIEDKNNSYAAVNSASLDADSQIIVDADRSVDNGDVVRIKE